MSAQDLIARLQKVRRTGDGRWVACCPAHEDKSPSLAVRELSDGRVLIKCFAGCLPLVVMLAVGLTFNDLFPERLPNDQYKPIRKPFPAADVLELLRNEVTIVQLAACDISSGKPLTEEFRSRLTLAAGRIQVAIDG